MGRASSSTAARETLAGGRLLAGVLGLGLGAGAGCAPLVLDPLEGPLVFGNLYVNNANEFEISLSIRPLRDELELDCEALSVDPGWMLRDEAFGEAQHLRLPARTNVAVLLGEQACGAALIAGQGIEPTILFAHTAEYPIVFHSGSSLEGELDETGLGIRFEGEGAASWIGDPTLRFVPRSDPLEQPEGCGDGSGEGRIEWSRPPERAAELLGLEIGADGCHALMLQQLELVDGAPAPVGTPELLTVCAPASAVPFAPGDRLELAEFDASWGRELMVTLLEDTTLEYAVDEDGVELLRARYLRGIREVSAIRYRIGRDAYTDDKLGCEWRAESGCATVERRIELVVDGHGYLERGEATVLEDTVAPAGGDAKRRTLFLVRASERALVDPSCSEGAVTPAHDIHIALIDEPLDATP